MLAVAEVIKPVDGGGGMVDGEAHERGVGGAAIDADHIGVVVVWRVLDATLLLPPRPRSGEVAARNMQRSADLRRALDHGDTRSALGGEDGARQTGAPGTDDDDIELLA